MTTQITVNASALRQVLHALIGPDHLIRELQATRSLHKLGHPNPIQALLDEFNATDGGQAPKYLTMPAMTESLREVLGMPVHQYMPIVRALQRLDPSIKSRFEDEQAALLHWALGFWFQHGDGWREAAGAALQRLVDEERAA